MTIPHKTAVVWPLTSYLTNYPSKTNKMWDTAGEARINSEARNFFRVLHMDPPARIYLPPFCADTRYDLKDLLGAMDDMDGEKVRELIAQSAGTVVYTNCTSAEELGPPPQLVS